MKELLEFTAVWLLIQWFRWTPRKVSRACGALLGAIAYRVLPRLRKTGMRNIELAFPEKTPRERAILLRAEYRNLGWLLAEFCQMAGYTPESTRRLMRTEGLEHFSSASAKGRGVLVVTGHLGAWELSSFYHSLMGYPMGMVIRRLDNSRLDRYVNRLRCLHGNRVLHKDDFARGLLQAMRQGEAVGILMDTNMTPPQGLFVDFFGHAACTASGLARVAAKTGAAVLPGFMVWEEQDQQYVLRFGPELKMQVSGEPERDAEVNTQLCTSVIEDWVRRYPGQWLWLHRRWKTRPPGESSIY